MPDISKDPTQKKKRKEKENKRENHKQEKQVADLPGVWQVLKQRGKKLKVGLIHRGK
jgi:hypothetical protein